MSQHRTASKIVAGVALVAGLVVGLGGPAQANDTGWGGTSVKKNSDTGWGGTKYSDTGWGGTKYSDTGWGGTIVNSR